ncbi:hypothetical protein KSS87_017116 [Heliosperma pusillum]|nr:hypothetical protein KSS87_017116 [Heliosperma pusillum]
MESGGVDSEGRVFKNAAEMWAEHVGVESQKRLDWYRNGVGYWQAVEASVDGVLGGYGNVSDADITSSEAFLRTLFSDLHITINSQLVSLDCGSGIGRVTKNLLIRYFHQVDLLEPVSHFLETARQTLTSQALANVDHHKALNFYCLPLQEFIPEPGRYDVIWIQWCIGHLTDDDFVSFFKNAKVGLKPGGFFILKENIAKSGKDHCGFVLDKEDCSVTRSDAYFKELFRRCGLHVYKIKGRRLLVVAWWFRLVRDIDIGSDRAAEEDQKGFPQELFAVKMYALMTELPKRSNQPRTRSRANRPAVIK